MRHYKKYYYKKYQRGVYRKKSLKDLKGDHKLARERQPPRLRWWSEVATQPQAHFDDLAAWHKKDVSSLVPEEMCAHLKNGMDTALYLARSLMIEQMGLRLEMIGIAQAVEQQDLLCKRASIALKEGDRDLDTHLKNISKETSDLKKRVKGITRLAEQRALQAPDEE